MRSSASAARGASGGSQLEAQSLNPAVVILSVLFFTSSIMCVAMVLAWVHFDRRPHAAIWAFAFGGGALQWLINALGVIGMPDNVAPIILASAIVIVTSSLVAIGARQRSGLPACWGRFAASGAVAIAVIVVIYTRFDHMGLRAGFTNLYAAIMMPLAAAAVLPRDRKANAPEIAFATMMIIFCIYQLTLGLAGLSIGAARNPEGLEHYRVVLGIGLPAAYVGSGVAVLFLVAGDLSESLRALVTRDPLTGSLNRRGLEQAATVVMANARRHAQPLSVIVGDIDHFKTINDRMGHAAGDRALVAFSDHVHAGVREEDLFGRLGGDEFCLVLINALPDQAAEVIERTRREIAVLEIEGPPCFSLTASFGIASFMPGDLSFADMLRRADHALYESKAAGRNRTTISAEEVSGTAAR